ncbi:LacI family transcriptional regulator [Mucilaginibacter sp. PPCGB 2223]|uniref:LacI family DNA-binding transcriptional regulator n=1 Tax=Mucilaginibacter sp. PPCGB 2223 TaxID=1886027 RepID=UPI00082523A5|nr:LacI family DNA-binding transcriptional regulator [Mucilaginibacter sp. PPCGB 2223]OCX52277.1 LacI family transcriptional regulator [Mucilaginibacter sp. PPCGB 2223]
MSSVTIKQLAEQLQLSTATISKALGDSYEISESTKKRVLALAKELNYIPNAYAGSLRHNKSKTIGVLVPEVTDSFFSLALNGIEEVALEKGYHTLIYLTHEKLSREEAILKALVGGRVDGVIMSVTVETDSFGHIHEFNRHLPVVFFDRVCPEIDTAKITTDDFECGYKATQHLIEAGCHKIVLLSISNSLSIISERTKGFKKAIAEYNLNEDDCRIVNCTEDPQHNYELIKEMMQSDNRPDGILATVEKLTTEIYLACQHLNINIPGQVKVVCFSNQPSAIILTPSLTTITQPAFEMGKVAATTLLKLLKNNTLRLKDECTVIPSKLIIRNSTTGQVNDTII